MWDLPEGVEKDPQLSYQAQEDAEVKRISGPLYSMVEYGDDIVWDYMEDIDELNGEFILMDLSDEIP